MGKLALCYYKGAGVEQDMKEAVKWCREAAGKGDPQAQAMLFQFYAKGEGVEQDMGKP